MATAIEQLSIEAQKRATDEILEKMEKHLDGTQLMELNKILNNEFNKVEFTFKREEYDEDYMGHNIFLKEEFLKAKQVEGCSKRTLGLYNLNINYIIDYFDKPFANVTTEDIREFFTFHQQLNDCSNVTLNGIRRVYSSYFGWLSDNGYILKNPMSRIKKIKEVKKVKKAYSSRELEVMRQSIPAHKLRQKAVFELLLSSGIRLGELQRLNITDMNWDNLTFKVLGKGNKERICYFNDKAKLALQNYLKSRKDSNPALFVTEIKPYNRVGLFRHQQDMRELGRWSGVENVHAHRFRRTCATIAINRGMPIEQVQKLLGHESITTTMIYINVDQNAVKLNHKKYMN